MTDDRTKDALAKLDAAQRLLDEVRNAGTVNEVLVCVSQADRVEFYVRQCRAGLDAQNRAAEIRLRCERRLGEMLSQTEFNKGGRPRKNRSQKETGFTEGPVFPTLSEIGLNKMRAQRLRRLAEVPEPEFVSYVETVQSEGLELTTAGVLSRWRELFRPPTQESIPDDISEEQPVSAHPPARGTAADCLKAVKSVTRWLKQSRDVLSALCDSDFGEPAVNASAGHTGCKLSATGRTVRYGELGPVPFGVREFSCDALDELLGLCGSLRLIYQREADRLPQPSANGHAPDPWDTPEE